MTENQVFDLFEIIDIYSPGFASEDRVEALAAIWSLHLQDLDSKTAASIVHAHYAKETRWIMPADIRRHAARIAGVLPPDADAGHAQMLALFSWYGPPGSHPAGTRPTVHPAVEATIKVVGTESAAAMNRFDWRAAYAPRAAEFEQRALAPGGIQAARAEIEAERATPKPAIEPAPEPAPETGGRTAELRARHAANMARLDESIAELGDDGRFLLPKGMTPGTRFGRAALAARLSEYGFDRDPDEAMRLARLEIARHGGSRQAADFEAHRAAQLRICETMMEQCDG